MIKFAEFLNQIKDYVDNKNDLSEYEMSSWIEDFMIENGDEVSKINVEVANFINDRIVCEICEQTEPKLEGTNFRKEIEEAYGKLLNMID